jgi:GDP-D-mannose dehydratase
MSVVLIGGSGQDAFYLAKYLSDSGENVYWLHRSSLKLYEQYLQNERIKCFQVSSYSYQQISSSLSDLSYSSVVLIAGAVGNSLARETPNLVYDTNIQILSAVCSLILNSKYQPHLYYFSSCDIDGRTSTSPFLFSPLGLTAPKTTYGLSKRHSGDLLKCLVNSGHLSSTLVYLGMHESFCRQGNYVLSKVKSLIRSKLMKTNLEPVSFGNLDIWLDIGFAPEYMQIIGDLIMEKYRPIEISIGTGKYTQLKLLCRSILEDYQIPFEEYVRCNESIDEPTFYPLMPSTFMRAHSPGESNSRLLTNGPSPLTSLMLKSENYSFQVN